MSYLPRRSLPTARSSSVTALALPLVLLLALLGAIAAGAQPTMEPISGLPEGLPDWLAPLLSTDGYAVTTDGSGKIDLWFRADLPERPPTGEFGIDFGQFPDGALIGLARVETTWGDYKKQQVPPGLYTLRYGIQPADGDHTGQTYFRDFIMLVPLDADVFVADGVDDPEPMVQASAAGVGTKHPAVMALYQVYEPVEETRIMENDFGEPILAAQVDGQVLGVVVEGFGTELTL